MKTSEQGRKLLIQREGLLTEAYRDSKGYWTIGVGHLLSLDKTANFGGTVWTKEQCEEVFEQDLAKYEKSVNDCVKVPLEQHQFDALVSFQHNLGVNALPHGNEGRPSSVLRALNAGDYEGAGHAFNNWMADPEVRTRRAGERDQFLGIAFEPTRPV